VNNKVKCVCCHDEYNAVSLDDDGICVPCNLEDECPDCGCHELDCTCDDEVETADWYGFEDDDFEDDDGHDEMDDWEGDDWDDDDFEDDDDEDW